MADRRDYYDVLGIDRGAAQDDIKKAYRKAAMRYHPDKNPGSSEAEERFKEAAEAYAVLSDPDKRARYDRFGHAGVSTSAAGPGFGGFDPSIFADFSDILGDFFSFGFGGGEGPRRGGSRRGADLRYQLEIPFEEMVKGAQPTIKVPRLEPCDKCHGSGAASASGRVRCPDCRGRGQVAYSQGIFTIARTCPRCQGAGEYIKDPCRTCHGHGRTEVERTIKVAIPAGIESGSRIRVRGQGEGGLAGGPSGDLYVDVLVKDHPFWQREGPDLQCRIPISFPQAALGTSLEVPLLDGEEISVDVPRGTQSNTSFRMRGKGLSRLDGYGRGDLYVFVDVRTPTDLRPEEEELYRKLLEACKSRAAVQRAAGKEREDAEEGGRSIFDKVKSIFG